MKTFKKKLQFPHPLVLLTVFVLIAAALSYLLPAGEYLRQMDPVTGRMVVVAGSYHLVASSPVNLFDAFVALPKGMADAADVIFLIFLIGGAFTVVDETGTLRRSISSLIRSLNGRDILIIPVVSIFFTAAGAVENMQEEIIALIPVLLILTNRVGFPPIITVAMSLGSAMLGSAFSPINPFQVQIAQKLAELPLGSGGFFRFMFLMIALSLWITFLVRYASKNKGVTTIIDDSDLELMNWRDKIVLLLTLIVFAIVAWGMTSLGWDFYQLSAAFFIYGVVVGLFAGMNLTRLADTFIKGFRDMAFAAILVGFARAIFVVLEQGHIIDTIVYNMVTPLQNFSALTSSIGMVVAQALIHFPVPSVSGQAVLTLPILVPASDLLEIPRQVTVLAYQYGAGLCDFITPTNGALMAILVLVKLSFKDWIKFILPAYLGMVGLGIISMIIAMNIGLQ